LLLSLVEEGVVGVRGRRSPRVAAPAGLLIEAGAEPVVLGESALFLFLEKDTMFKCDAVTSM
jgi:hypothetical protein